MLVDQWLFQNLEIFTEEERKQNWQLLWDVLDKKISKEELAHRLQIMERTVEIAHQNAKNRGA